jgi:pantoate--beta-alanine ligase
MSVMNDEPFSESVRPPLATTVRELREAVGAARGAGRTIGLTPTMGALHEGHLSLVRACRQQCGFTVVTIFINPTQFGAAEDLHTYPRSLDKDLETLAACGVDLVFAPAEAEVYPAGFSTYVEPPAVAAPLEGRCRPGHFRGVATIVLKLLHMAGPDEAFFGAKDYQQSLVIRRMVEDFNIPVRVQVCPTVRETDGLAMSSRNQRLSREDRRRATALSRSLERAAQLAAQGERDAGVIRRAMRRVFDEAGIVRVDYIALVRPETLEDLDRLDGPAVAAVAAHVGGVRLIDNRCIG